MPTTDVSDNRFITDFVRMAMATTFTTTARLVFIVAAAATAASRLASTGAPETEVRHAEAARVVFIQEPATDEALPSDVPRIVVTAKRMTPDEKAAFDAEQTAMRLATRQ
jgi:hypothetical protein